MRPFRFKAQAVLDLRKRQDDEAQRVLADAVRTRRHADTIVAAAATAVDKSMRQARQALAAPASGTEHDWHRNWIRSRQHELDAARAGLAECRAAEGVVRQRAHEAHRAHRMLERWFDRAWRRDQQERRRIEQRELDEIGTLQYETRRRA